MLLGRYASIQQIDPVIAEVNRQGAMGSSMIWLSISRKPPKISYPDKPERAETSQIVVHNVHPNVFVFQFVIVYANQGDVSQYASAALRYFPLLRFFCIFPLAGRVGVRRPALHRNLPRVVPQV